MLLKHAAREVVNLALAHGFKPRPLCGNIKSPDSRKYAKMCHAPAPFYSEQ